MRWPELFPSALALRKAGGGGMVNNDGIEVSLLCTVLREACFAEAQIY